MSGTRIAVLSLSCRFPEADSPQAFWQNILDGRRSFRPLPAERLPLADYASDVVGEADSIPDIPAGLISDWSFDRVRHHIPERTFAATDLTHWLALDLAGEALAAIGGVGALPRDRTAVILGDTLTGEFTRAAQLRLRLPYLSRVLAETLDRDGLDPGLATEIARGFADRLRQDFLDPNEESLAGALANTIAGRIANYFDLHGGAWTVDGACASSLLAMNDACTRIAEGSVEVVVAGGVDLSLDPFELVGFARAGALNRGEMRVFDRRAAGFWPGEGCGMAVLASERAARAMGAEPMGWIRGWGVSTDGAGGLTRPTVSGQENALHRAWARAGTDPAQAAFFEAHGTGTPVGDPVEIRGLAALLGEDARGIPVGSVKANIGHTKAAAGMAGMIKAVMGLREGIVPPHVSCEEPAAVFAETGHRLAPAEARETGGRRTAGVSGFGFGGVNAHLVVEGPEAPTRRRPIVAHLPQDAELFLFAADTREALDAALAALEVRAPLLSRAELRDAAGSLRGATGNFRTGFTAATPAELTKALAAARAGIATLAPVTAAPRIGYVFPGQAAPVRPAGGLWARRFPGLARDLGLEPPLPGVMPPETAETATAQPAIVAGSLLALAVLDAAGIEAVTACGHSLGELTALAWAGSLTPTATVELARARGRAMSDHGLAGGAMLRLPLPLAEAETLAWQNSLSVACLNGSRDVVLSGDATAAARLVEAVPGAALLKVSHAFHSPHMALARDAFAAVLADTALGTPRRQLVSTVTGAAMPEPPEALRTLLIDQLTDPVRFAPALEAIAPDTDILLEVGPGTGLARLAAEAGLACLSVDACAPSLRGLLDALARLWELGAPVDTGVLFDDRPLRPLSAEAPVFLANPCGRGAADTSHVVQVVPETTAPAATHLAAEGAPLDTVLAVVSEELGLPVSAIPPEARMLDDLHLNSLAVGRIVAGAAARMQVAIPMTGTDFTAATVAELAAHLAEMQGIEPETAETLEGVADWAAEYCVTWQPARLPERAIGGWQVFGPFPEPLAADPDRALVVIGPCDGAPDSTAVAQALWDRVKAARASGARQLAILHHGSAVTGLARTLVAERVFGAVVTVDVGETPNWSRAIAVAEAGAGRPHAAFRLTGADVLAPVLEVCPVTTAQPGTLGPDDTLLVIGGARGIGAECALDLGQATGCRLVLAGRSDSEAPEVTATLARARTLGLDARYISLDLTDTAAARTALASLAPTALLHAAGVNRPGRFDDLTRADLEATLSPKLGGLETLIGALDASRLRLAIGFGSIIGALGLEGEAHYALANDLQSQRLLRWGTETGVRVLALDWSVWAGAGMGERLGAVESLSARGVQAIPLSRALARLRMLVSDPEPSGRMIVTSRFGPPDHVSFARPDVPPLRFIETERLHFPGVELIAEAELMPGSDPWLEDHVVGGRAVVPGVLLLEAMAQAAQVLTGTAPRHVTAIAFDHAVSADASGTVRLRVAALRRDDGTVEAVIRSDEDGFAANRARAVLHTAVGRGAPEPEVAASRAEPAGVLYDRLWFNRGRFARIATVEHAAARSVRVALDPGQGAAMFGAYQPQRLLLGDPGLRDSGLHALQICAAQRRVLPVSVARVRIVDPSARPVTVTARERWSDDRSFCFDLAWRDAEGRVTETWEAAEFRAVAPLPVSGLPRWMLPAVLERAAMIDRQGAGLCLALAEGGDQPLRRKAALAQVGRGIGPARGDGAPTGREAPVTLSHAGPLTLAATAEGPVGCDLVLSEEGVPPPRAGDAAAVATLAAALDETQARALVWAARESLRKAGAPVSAGLSVTGAEPDGTVRMRSGGSEIYGASLGDTVAVLLIGGAEPARAFEDGLDKGAQS